MKAILFRGADALRAELEEMGVLGPEPNLQRRRLP